MEVIPATRPSLRDIHSPQPHATMEEDVKRHSAPDSPPPPRRHKEKVQLLVFHNKINYFHTLTILISVIAFIKSKTHALFANEKIFDMLNK